MNQHNLEKLFQEKFKDFEPELPQELWQNIKAQLPQEKPKKSYFWYKFSGFVAVLILGFFIFNQENKIEKIKFKNNKLDINKSNSTIYNSKTETNAKNSIIKQEQNNIVSTNKIDAKKTNTIEPKNTNIKLKNKILVNNSNASEQLTSLPNNQNNTNEDLISSQKTETISENNINPLIKEKDEQKVLVNTSSFNPTNTINTTTNPFSNPVNQQIVSNLETTKLNNSLAINASNIVNDSLETLELTKEKTNKKIKEHQKNRWQFSSLIAPIFANNFNNNSSINSVLDSNEKINYQSLSYGAYLQYQITPKLGIRSGISHLNTIQQTNDVAYTSQMDTQNAVFRASSITFLPSQSGNDQELLFRRFNTGTLKQEINFLEIPLELNYLLMDKKLQINVLGGASMFLLSSDNSYLKTTENQNINLGNASNINATHYSINFGFGASYPIFSKMRFQLQPTVRYQINTFSQNNNKPYYLGIFTGISFNF